MWQEYINASSINEVLEILAERGHHARVVAGATDLFLELEKGQRKGVETLIDITRITGLDTISLDSSGILHIGPNITHNQCVKSELVRQFGLPLAQAAWQVGAPQIRNRGTIAGNLITASPANDTITPLMALGASIMLKSKRGERVVPLESFYTGVRQTIMKPDELLMDIQFPVMKPEQRGIFLKFGLRKVQAISVVNVSILLTMNGEKVQNAVITLGAVAPTVIHAHLAEEYLIGKELNELTIEKTAYLAMNDAHPITDIRGSTAFRRTIVKVNTRRALQTLLNGQEKSALPEEPVLLWGRSSGKVAGLKTSHTHQVNTPIETVINAKRYTITSGQNKSLLSLLRDDLHLIGTKEGCSEGECGACTVFLDGMAVMACLVPAPRAQGTVIETIEGLAQNGTLHPVQQAFVEEGAVQCGYCTPGFIMSAVKLLEEKGEITGEEIRQSISGNLCRCTGYYKIIKAIEKASSTPVIPYSPSGG